MARKQKMVVDYFPHYVNDGKTIFILESKFGNDGYSFWFKLLEILGKSPKHFFDCRDTYNFNFLLAKTRVIEEKAIEILDLLAGLNAIDPDLWKEKILYSENFIGNLDTVYNRRDTQPATKKEINDNINDLSKILMSTEIPQNEDNVSKSTQRKGKESRVKEIIIPETLKSISNFIQTWNEWTEYRKEKRKTLTPKSIKLQFKFLQKQTDPIATINQSIQNGWEGLFEVKNGKQKSPGATDDYLAKQSAERLLRKGF